MKKLLMATQSVRIGWRPYVNPSITASSLWTSIYSVYNADAVGSPSLKTSLFAAYNFDNNLNDAVGSKNGTGYGGINYGSTSGLINTSIGFNGANAYVNLPNNTGQFNFTDDFSISLWVKPYTTSGYPFLICNYLASGSNNYGYYLYMLNNTDLRFGILNGTNSALTNVNQLPPSNVWTYIVITRKKSTITKIYYNGVLMTPSSSTNPTLDLSYQPNTTTTLGAAFGDYKYSGWMDSLNFWTKELTQSEITELYNSGNGVQYTTDNFYKQTTNDALNTYNGTAQGGLTYGVGKVGTAFQFNGTNAYVSLPNNSFKFTGNFSVSLWFYCKTSSNAQTLINGYDYTGSLSGGWVLVVFGTGNFLDFQTYINTQATSKSRYQVGFNTSTYNNQWVHITLTRVSSTSTKIYINGTEASGSFIKGSVTDNPTYLTNCYSEIGGDFVTSGGLINPCDNGTKIDAVNIWNKELTASEITELYNSGNGKQYTSSLDSDAQTFITDASITDTTQQSAINTLVTDLKSANIWTKMKAIYPFVGGTAQSHKFNLKDPRDVDAAYRLVFNGGWTHTSTGALPNGTTGYADTKLKPSNIAQNSAHMSTYLRTTYSNGVDMGCSTNNYFYISANLGPGTPPRGPLNLSTYSDASPQLDTKAFYLASKTNSTTNKLFRNTTLISNETSASVTPEAYNIYIGAGNRNNAGWLYSLRETAFASIGDGLTDAEALAFYNAVQAFQTSLGRNV